VGGGLLSQAEASLEVDRALPGGRIKVRSWRGRYDRDVPSALPDPILPELREDVAPPGVAAVYARLRECTGGPGAGLVWRHAAALPGGLEWLWAQARPALESGAAAGSYTGLATIVDAAMSAVPLPGDAASGGGGLAAADEAAAALVRSGFRADLIDLVLVTAIKLRWDGVPAATSALPVRPHPAASSAAAPPPLPRLSQLPRDSARTVRRLADALGPGTADAVPDLFLHLASWPGLLAALPERLAPLLEPVVLAEVRDVVIGAAQAEALSLLPALGPATPAPVACRGALHDALYVFTRRVLPGAVPVSFAVRVLLGGAAASD